MVWGMALEKLSFKLPTGFDPQRHTKALLAIASKQHGPGWDLDSIDISQNTATFTRQAATMEINEVKGDGGGQPDAFEIRLAVGTRPTDGDKVAARQADLHPGYYLVRFEPHVGKAVLAKLSDPELRCRGAVANALGVKPWDVMVSQRRDGGFAMQLPGAYTPSKHDAKLREVAEQVVGKFGWYVTVNPKTLVAQIVPSEPSTFPAIVPFRADRIKPVPDFSKKSDKERFTVDLAEGLGRSGEKNLPVTMSFEDSTAVLVVGLPGSGKSLAVKALVCQFLIKGFRLAVIDTPAKKTDYAWAKPYVEDHWWGCDDSGTSVSEALTVATLLDEEGKRMGALLNEYGAEKWQDLPEQVKKENPPVLVVADELANLLNKPTVPSGLSKEAKELPQFMQMAQDYLEAKLLTVKLNSLVAVHRAAGIREMYLTQRPSRTEGFPPELKSLIPHRVQLGPSPSDADIAMAFRDAKRIPRVPTNVAIDEDAARGCGIAHLDGSDPVVIKGFFGKASEFEKLLREHLGPGDPSDARVRPTAEQIDRCVPRADGTLEEEDGDDEPMSFGEERLPSGKPVSSLDPKFGPVAAEYGEDGKRLRGAAAAAAQSKRIADGAKKSADGAVTVLSLAGEKLPICPSCDLPIQPNGDCGCS